MSYTKNAWTCGDVITAEKLNNMEDGIEQAVECCGGGSAPLIFSYTMEETTAEECPYDGRKFTYSHSWREIYDALASGRAVVQVDVDESGIYQYSIESAYFENGIWSIGVSNGTYCTFDNTTSKTYITCSGK